MRVWHFFVAPSHRCASQSRTASERNFNHTLCNCHTQWGDFSERGDFVASWMKGQCCGATVPIYCPQTWGQTQAGLEWFRTMEREREKLFFLNFPAPRRETLRFTASPLFPYSCKIQNTHRTIVNSPYVLIYFLLNQMLLWWSCPTHLRIPDNAFPSFSPPLPLAVWGKRWITAGVMEHRLRQSCTCWCLWRSVFDVLCLFVVFKGEGRARCQRGRDVSRFGILWHTAIQNIWLRFIFPVFVVMSRMHRDDRQTSDWNTDWQHHRCFTFFLYFLRQ